MAKSISPEEFLERGKQAQIVDVRSPGEYENGHIPRAINLPLFENQEREIVGILYKNKGRQEAIRKGLEIVGPKMTQLVDQAIQLASTGEILVHCWRGGMRSSSVAWLFEAAGLQVYLLEGGYKNYRRFARENMLLNRRLLVLGGLTGSGKTKLIQMLAAAGEPVLDLESLANHRGSAFGGVGLSEQPSTEHFENRLFEAIQMMPAGGFIWVEDESRRIGKVFQPEYFHQELRTSPIVFVEVSDPERRTILVDEYGKQPPKELEDALKKLQKRLGGLLTKQALQALREQNYEEVAALLLPYYDQQYTYGVGQRNPTSIRHVNLKNSTASERIQILSGIRKNFDQQYFFRETI